MHPCHIQPSRRRAGRVALAAGLLALLSGCSAAGAGGSGGATTTSAGTVRDRVMPIYRELTQCIRANGYPEFPDPVVAADGTVTLSPEAQQGIDRNEARLRRACEHIFNRLPPELRGDDDGGEPQATPEQVDQLRRLAACMRRNGFAEFPDPKPDGSFPMTDQIEREGKSPRLRAAMRACREVNPDPKGGLRFSGPDDGGRP